MLRPLVKIVRSAVCLAALATATPAVGQTRIEPSLTVNETFSDNVDADPDGEEEAAFLTDVVPAVTLRRQSARVNAALDAALTARHQTAGEDAGIELLPNVAGFGTAEVIDQLFFVDASASVSQQLLNTREADAESNRETVQNYSLSPSLVGHFGSFADGELRYTLQQVLGGDGGVSDATTHTGRMSLSSGADFTRLLWSVSASMSESKRTDDTDVTRRDANIGLEYIVVRSFSLLGSAGYQFFDDGTPENEVDSPSWRAGFRWRPGPRLDLSAGYGESDDETSFDGRMTYRIGPRTTVFANYRERLETGQERLARDLSFIGIDPDTGELVDTRTGLPFDPNTSLTEISDRTERTRTARAGLSGVRGRNTFSMQGSYEISTVEGAGRNEEETAIGVSASWGRQLSPHANLIVSGNYLRSEFDDVDETDNEYSAAGTLSYNIYTNVNAFASYVFSMQDSTNGANEFSENRVSAGVQMGF